MDANFAHELLRRISRANTIFSQPALKTLCYSIRTSGSNTFFLRGRISPGSRRGLVGAKFLFSCFQQKQKGWLVWTREKLLRTCKTESTHTWLNTKTMFYSPIHEKAVLRSLIISFTQNQCFLLFVPLFPVVDHAAEFDHFPQKLRLYVQAPLKKTKKQRSCLCVCLCCCLSVCLSALLGLDGGCT